jgi:hypothetical protein
VGWGGSAAGIAAPDHGDEGDAIGHGATIG